MSQNKPSFEKIISEVASEYEDEDLTEEQLSHFFKTYFEHIGIVMRSEKMPMINIPKLGTLEPVPSRVRDEINSLKDELNNSELMSKKMVKDKLDKLKTLTSQIGRVEDEINNYNKKGK